MHFAFDQHLLLRTEASRISLLEFRHIHNRIMITSDEKIQLIERAREQRDFSHAPYSNFRVGAALLFRDGTIESGSNVESSSFGLTICAERVAMVKAVSIGKHDVVACAVVTDTSTPTSPCGACRQFLYDFNPEMIIVMATISGEQIEKSLSDLLPLGFSDKQWKLNPTNQTTI